LDESEDIEHRFVDVEVVKSSIRNGSFCQSLHIASFYLCQELIAGRAPSEPGVNGHKVRQATAKPSASRQRERAETARAALSLSDTKFEFRASHGPNDAARRCTKSASHPHDRTLMIAPS
jgi:hypothetical protein